MNIDFLLKIAFLFLFFQHSYCQKNKNNFTFELSGKALNSNDSDKIYLSFNSNGKRIVDSVEIKKKSFYFKSIIKNPTKAYVSRGREFYLDGVNSCTIYLEPNNNKIVLDYLNFSNTKVENSITHLEFMKLEFLKDSVYRERKRQIGVLKSERDFKKKSNDDFNDKQHQKNIDSILNILDVINKREIDLEFKFIKNNQNSYVSLDLLAFRLKRKEGKLLIGKIDSLFESLSSDIKKSPIGLEMKDFIHNSKFSDLGNKAPNFNLKDINNNQISLDSFKGEKIILLDFWATWCAPCREDFTYLKEAFELYNEKGFEIISVSKDDNLESWKKTIKKDEIDKWKHILIKENYKNTSSLSKIEEDYFVNSIPVKILINKDGIIIGRWRGGGIENREELDKLLMRVFELK
jgi:peroxiredoxin